MQREAAGANMRGVRPRPKTTAGAVLCGVLAAGLVVVGSAAPVAPELSAKLNAPIVAAIKDPAVGYGYWELGADGAVLAFDGAKYFGSVPALNVKLEAPIVGMAPTADGGGYWLLDRDGHVYAFGDARSLGNAPGNAAAIVPDGAGYRVIAALGTSVAFVPGVTSAETLTTPVVPPASLFHDSIFNSNVQSWPVDPHSALYATDIVNDYKTDYGSIGVNTIPIYYVPAKQRMVPVSVTPGCNNFVASTGESIPFPSFAALNGSGDNPIAIYQPSTGKDWELWKVKRTAHGIAACWAGELDMGTSDGVFPWPFGLSATGISYLATTITQADVASGQIDHAIATVIPRCDYSTKPADRGDCGSDPGQPAEGQWFRFPANLAMPSGLTPFAQMVFRAIQTYGMVVTDQGGAVAIEAEQPSDWAAEGHSGTAPTTATWQGLNEYQVVADLPWGDLQTVDPPSA